MDMWDTDEINLVGQGHVTFDPRGGEMAFVCVTISLNCRETVTKGTSLAFTFVGDEEGDKVSGSGTTRLTGPDKITAKLRFHGGDKSGLVARRVT